MHDTGAAASYTLILTLRLKYYHTIQGRQREERGGIPEVDHDTGVAAV